MKICLSNFLFFLILTVTISGCVPLAIGVAGGAAAGGVTSTSHPGYSAATYAGTVLGNGIYFPAKLIFAVLGAAGSGFVYLGSGGNEGMSRKVWEAGVEGDWVLTPAMVSGEQPVAFVGP